MIQVYLLALGELRRRMEKMARTKGKPDAAALPGWDKLADWQQEKISRCAWPGSAALCMGGQLLLQYAAYKWSVCADSPQTGLCGKQQAVGDREAKESVSREMSDTESARAEEVIFWNKLDFSRLPGDIPASQPLAVAYGARGKPHILQVPWHYNLSHSGDYTALAISDAPVGIDIQQMRPYRDSLVKRFFATEEAAACEELCAQGSQGREDLFYTLWCRKEAYGKLLGTGLTEDVLKRNMLGDAGVHFCEYGELSGYCICVCMGKR